MPDRLENASPDQSDAGSSAGKTTRRPGPTSSTPSPARSGPATTPSASGADPFIRYVTADGFAVRVDDYVSVEGSSMPRGAPCRSGRCPSGEGSGHRTGPCSSNSGQELSAVDTGVRILPLSITLLLAALAGAVLISALTNSFLSGHRGEP
jgi:hypothetical protein